MRGMNSETVDLIYLDPPFNSNRDYAAPIGSEAAGAAFKDTWTLSDVDEAWHREIAEKARRSQIEQAGPLPVRENGSVGHGRFRSGKGWKRAAGSGVEKSSSRFLEGSASVQVVVESARGNAAEFAADIGYRACLVGHEVLGVA